MDVTLNGLNDLICALTPLDMVQTWMAQVTVLSTLCQTLSIVQVELLYPYNINQATRLKFTIFLKWFVLTGL